MSVAPISPVSCLEPSNAHGYRSACRRRFCPLELKRCCSALRSSLSFSCGRAQVKASLSCTAEALKWLWVLHGVIEKTMLAQAKENITALIDYFQEGVNTKAHQDTTPRVSWRALWNMPSLCQHSASL